MSSPSLTRGSLYGILEFPKKKPPSPQKNKGTLEFLGKDLYSKSFFKLFLKKLQKEFVELYDSGKKIN